MARKIFLKGAAPALTALFALTLVLALVFVSCDNGTTGDDGGSGGGEAVPGANLSEKLAWLEANAENDGSYLITVNTNESTHSIIFGRGSDLAWYHANYGEADDVIVDLGDRTGVTVTLRGVGGNRTISLASNDLYGPLFNIRNDVTLVLGNNITLKGNNVNGSQMVTVLDDGTLVMNAGSAITDNDGTEFGGGVYSAGTFVMNGGVISDVGWYGVVMDRTGAFTMNGGTISGNRVTCYRATFTMNGGTISGGYVYIGDGGRGGTFTMNGGVISGNNSEYGGGGVTLASGTFTMRGGTITGNTALFGGGVLVAGGTFTKTGGTITGSDTSGGNAATRTSGGDNSFDSGDPVFGGNAVFAGVFNNGYTKIKRKETTSGLSDNLSFNGTTGAFTGEWDE